jgi:sugar phosphate isomerase/epimerase
MADPSRLALNTATVRMQWTLRQAVEGCQRHGLKGITVWREPIAEIGLPEAAKLLRGSGLDVVGLCRAGLFAADTPQKVLDDNRRAVDEAAAVGARTLCIIGGGLPAGSKDVRAAWDGVRDGLAALLPHARAAGVVLALEPLHPMYAADRACINTLEHANDLCDGLGEGIGVAVDVYHVWWDPNLGREVARAGRAKRIVGFHICDWLVPTRDLLLDRGMMGDGVIDIRGIRELLEGAGFRGMHEVEIFSAENWWKRDPDEVVRTCIERHRRLC